MKTIDDDPLADLPETPSRRRRFRQRLTAPFLRGGRPRRMLLALVLFLPPALLLYYGIGGMLMHTVDDDTGYAAPAPPDGGSQALAMAAALIVREVDTHGWTANDPVFLPSWALDDMPNFQQGLIGGLATAIAVLDERADGDGAVAAGLAQAAELLASPGDRWVIDLETSWTPVAPAESRYREAAAALAAVNLRLAAGDGGVDRDAATLRAVLERLSADLGAMADRLAAPEAAGVGWPFDADADDLFYAAKGRVYAYAMLLDPLRRDVPGAVETVDRRAAWQGMVTALETAARLEPWAVVAGAPDGLILPNHLVAQGFYLLQAERRMQRVADALAE